MTSHQIFTSVNLRRRLLTLRALTKYFLLALRFKTTLITTILLNLINFLLLRFHVFNFLVYIYKNNKTHFIFKLVKNTIQTLMLVFCIRITEMKCYSQFISKLRKMSQIKSDKSKLLRVIFTLLKLTLHYSYLLYIRCHIVWIVRENF